MSEEWISANEARKIVAPGWKHGSPATDPIRQRAKIGVIKARASVYVSTRSGQSTTVHGHPIPKEFWGGHPFKENWTAGDFSTGIDVNGWYTDCEALGVTFERTEIEALAPPPVSAGNPSQAASSGITVPAPASRNSGGNPGKFDWAKAVGAIIFQWSDSGSWHPQSQGEVKTKLYDWFSEHGQTPDDKQLKQYARWLHSEFKSRGPERD
jgi:hypothetical protein